MTTNRFRVRLLQRDLRPLLLEADSRDHPLETTKNPGKDLKEKALRFGARAAYLLEQLTDLGDKRIAEMDAAGIDMQVLSLTSPGAEQPEVAQAIALAREANDFLADAVAKNPTRFAGFAVLPTAAPDHAAEELMHMVRDHGFKGAVTIFPRTYSA